MVLQAWEWGGGARQGEDAAGILWMAVALNML